jgi:hypothetical protein
VREFWSKRGALPAPQFAALRETFLASPLVGGSTLAGPFEASRGFAVTFRTEGRTRVLDRFAGLAPYFDLVMGEPAIRALTPWWRRKLTRIPNAWYLNVLLVSPGGTVARHVDATLRKQSGVDTAVPEVVSVLYLTIPSKKGGELRLWSGPNEIARLVPEENAVLHFRGDLAHEVCSFDAPEGVHRASLVIEQYHFEPDALARLPEFQLESRAGFGAFLKHHSTRGPGTFDLDP